MAGCRSALALLVAGVRANHADDILSFHDLAVLTLALDGGSDFHDDDGAMWVNGSGPKRWVRTNSTVTERDPPLGQIVGTHL